MANETLTGGALGSGTAVNKNQSDNFLVAGSYNTVDTFGGNETITGVNLPPYGPDNATIVNIGSSTGVNPASNVQVNDTIALDGGNNTIDAVSGVVLTQSTVTIGVSGGTGGNLVSLDNVGGSNSVNTGGPNNSITLNADASNQVIAGTGYDGVYLGTPGAAVGSGFTSNVALSGNGNIVEASDQNLNVDPGANNNFVEAGNGNDSVVLTGSGNLVALGDGTDTVNIGGSNNEVILELFGPAIAANTDMVTIGGNYNIVTETNLSDINNVTVTISGTIGGNTVALASGNETVNVGGGSNLVEVFGNGHDTVSLLGTAGFNNVLVGGGTDTVTVNGSGNVINVNPNGLPATDTVTATGNSNRINIGSTATLLPSVLNLGGASGDNVTLGTGSYNVTGTGTGSNNDITATDNAASTDNINMGSGNANAITFGDGTDTVTDNGDGNAFVGGNGNDTINAAGNSDAITLGNGNDLLNLGGNGSGISLGSGNVTVNGGNGSNNSLVATDAANTTNFYNFGTGSSNGFSLGDGNDTLTDNGNTVTVFAGNGNDTITADGNQEGIGLGSGNDVVFATGTGDTIVIDPPPTITDTVTVGSDSAGSVTGGTLDLNIGGNNINGNGNTFQLDGIQAGSTVNVFGNNNLLDFIDSSSGTINLANDVSGDTIEVFGSCCPGTYDGTLTVDNFQNNGVNATLDLENLYGGIDHNWINSLAEIAANSTVLPGGTLEILLQNHGAILLPLVTGLNATGPDQNVVFSGGPTLISS